MTQREEKRNNKRREKYARLHEQQRSDNEQHETANKRRHDGDYGNTDNRRGPGKKKSAQLAKKQGVPSKKQRKSEARAERRYDDDRRSKGKKHDERSSDAKRYDRHTEVKRGGRGERHDQACRAVPPSPCEHQESAVPHALIAEMQNQSLHSW